MFGRAAGAAARRLPLTTRTSPETRRCNSGASRANVVLLPSPSPGLVNNNTAGTVPIFAAGASSSVAAFSPAGAAHWATIESASTA